MITAVVLINTESGKELEVIRQLKGIPHVLEVYNVYGVYDIITKTQAEDQTQIKNIVFSEVRSVSNIRSTVTLTSTQPE